MNLLLGQKAPDFEQDTANGSIRFHAWLGASWGVLFSHPHKIGAMFATEVAVFAGFGAEWVRRGVKPVCLSADTAETLADVEATLDGAVDFPLIADSDGTVATRYGLDAPVPDTRALFVIDPAKVVRLAMVYPAGTACDFAEVLGAIDRLQRADARAG